jgi:hypothetical protein
VARDLARLGREQLVALPAHDDQELVDVHRRVHGDLAAKVVVELVLADALVRVVAEQLGQALDPHFFWWPGGCCCCCLADAVWLGGRLSLLGRFQAAKKTATHRAYLLLCVQARLQQQKQHSVHGARACVRFLKRTADGGRRPVRVLWSAAPYIKKTLVL